jgi:hypothetical protein
MVVIVLDLRIKSKLLHLLSLPSLRPRGGASDGWMKPRLPPCSWWCQQQLDETAAAVVPPNETNSSPRRLRETEGGVEPRIRHGDDAQPSEKTKVFPGFSLRGSFLSCFGSPDFSVVFAFHGFTFLIASKSRTTQAPQLFLLHCASLTTVELKLPRLLLPSSPLSGREAHRLFWICAEWGSIQPLIYFFVVVRKPKLTWIDCSVSECPAGICNSATLFSDVTVKFSDIPMVDYVQGPLFC